MFAAVLAAAGASAAADAPPSAAELKAAVIFNLLLFVEWPAAEMGRDNGFRLCVLEGGALENALKRIDGKAVHRLPLATRRVAATADELRPCHAVVVEVGNDGALARVAVAAKAQPLLVIGEGGGAAARGAMIGIDSEGGHVVFDIDYAAARRARLLISSRLLRLARQVLE